MKKQLLCLCVIAGLALSVQAAENQDEGRLSLNLDAGVNLMDDIEDGDGDSAEMDAGLGLSAGLSYALNQTVSVGFETGLRYNTVKDSESDAYICQVPLLATVALRYENESKFVPYVALGAGGAACFVGDDDDNDNDLVFAWQVEAGVRYKISDNASVGLAYKYLSVADQDYDFGGDKLELDSLSNHLIAATFSWSF